MRFSLVQAFLKNSLRTSRLPILMSSLFVWKQIYTNQNQSKLLSNISNLFQSSICFAQDFEQELPYLGCSIRSMNDQPGMEVILVNTESPAWKSGFKLGDVILEIDSSPVNNIEEYRDTLRASLQKSNSVEYKVLRKAKVKHLTVIFSA